MARFHLCGQGSQADLQAARALADRAVLQADQASYRNMRAAIEAELDELGAAIDDNYQAITLRHDPEPTLNDKRVPTQPPVSPLDSSVLAQRRLAVLAKK